MKYPNYSVLMSVYYKENPEFLKESIESILGQTIKPDQFVIVKDGNLNEELDEIISEYENKFPMLFSIVYLNENCGLAIALDQGLKVCRNDLVARMDSDDISKPDRCEKQLNKFSEIKKLAILGSNIDEFYDDLNVISSSRVVPSDYADICKWIKRRNPFNHPTVMFKKSEVLRCGGYGTLKRGQDFDLFSRMINMGCYAENINESLLLFRSDEDNYFRRKSKTACDSYINVVRLNFKRGYCSLFDLIYVVVVEKTLQFMPLGMMKFVSDHFLREKK